MKAKMEYTIREAAKLRGVCARTVRRRIRAGKISARLEIIEALGTVIYHIPKAELRKIKAEPGGRPRKPVYD